ncbi:hypothetical protein GJ496_008023 [Pomphorhynchus laevis]|nr:hypothetical protein GJ496_008023 [Pomphorhynchus laevis]
MILMFNSLKQFITRNPTVNLVQVLYRHLSSADISQTDRTLKFLPDHIEPVEAWLETLKSNEKLDILKLHPKIWAEHPRFDLISETVRWQLLYKTIDYNWTPRIHEMKGGTKKPWPQKGTGRARQGSNRSPQWVKGFKVNGPRGPKSYFYVLPTTTRLKALCSLLSIRFQQVLVFSYCTNLLYVLIAVSKLKANILYLHNKSEVKFSL